MIGHLRPRADEAHVPLEDVEKLRQLVKAQLADEAAKARFARIALHTPARILRVRDAHAAEFVHLKDLFFPAHALLTEDDRPGAAQLHADGDRKHDGRGQHDEQQRSHDVHRALARCPDEAVKRRGAHVDQLGPFDGVDGGMLWNIVIEEGDQAQAHALLVRRGKDIRHEGDLVRFQRDDQLIRALRFQNLRQLFIAAQAGPQLRFFHHAHIAAKVEAQLRISGDVRDVLLRKMPVAHDDHMLLVVATAAIVPQHSVHGGALGDDQAAGDEPEQQHHHARGVHDPHQKECRHQREHADATRQQHQRILVSASAHAMRAVHAQQIKHERDGEAVHQRDEREPGGTHVDADEAVHQVKPEEERRIVGEKDQCGVAHRVEPIEQPLVSFDHCLFLLSIGVLPFASPAIIANPCPLVHPCGA